MDPASAIITIVSTGFTVVGKINEFRKAVKDAPDQVQALQDSSVAVEVLLQQVQEAVSFVPLHPAQPQVDAYLESLCKNAVDNLKKVNGVVEKVVAQVPPSGGGTDKHLIRVNWKRWFVDKGKVEDLAGKLAEVRKALCETLEFLQMCVLSTSPRDTIAYLTIMAYRNYAQHTANSLNDMKWAVDTMALAQAYQSYVAAGISFMWNDLLRSRCTETVLSIWPTR